MKESGVLNDQHNLSQYVFFWAFRLYINTFLYASSEYHSLMCLIDEVTGADKPDCPDSLLRLKTIKASIPFLSIYTLACCRIMHVLSRAHKKLVLENSLIISSRLIENA